MVVQRLRYKICGCTANFCTWRVILLCAAHQGLDSLDPVGGLRCTFPCRMDPELQTTSGSLSTKLNSDHPDEPDTGFAQHHVPL